MSCHDRVYAWRAEVAAHLPRLSGPQVTVLALWSFGMVLAGSCGQTAVSAVLAAGLGRAENTLRQRLREWCYDAADKRGAKRQEVAVEGCFAALLGWVLRWWEGTQLALALDATTLGARFAVLTVSVVYRGCAIPVAWAVLPGNTPRAWRREWLRLLRLLGPAVPAGWTVIVLADRGLDARWLDRRIVRLGWHPFLRVNGGGTFRPTGQARYRPLWSFATAGGSWSGTGTAFQGPDRRLVCTLLVRWVAGCAQPWLILTDLPPDAADPCWYGMRAWIERGFKLSKRAGWQWQGTRTTDPDRAARLWLAVAVATLWLVSIGGEADAALRASTIPALPMPPRRPRRAARPRLVSVFRRGFALWIAALLNDAPLPTGHFRPEPWPTAADPALT
ncbi:MAG TPA: hypothetical protein VGJ53_17775, partial [Micromonosporaceae bacterium]